MLTRCVQKVNDTSENPQRRFYPEYLLKVKSGHILTQHLTINYLLNNFYKKGINKIDPAKIIVTLLVILALIFIGLYNRSKRLKADSERQENIRYTIGTTGNIYRNIKSSTPNVKYSYYVNFNKYSDDESIYQHNEGNVEANGGRYYVEFSSKNPSNGKLLLDFPVPTYITNAPILGWDKIPGQ